MDQSISKVFPVFQKKHTQQMDKQVCVAEKDLIDLSITPNLLRLNEFQISSQLDKNQKWYKAYSNAHWKVNNHYNNLSIVIVITFQ